ncbi:hypothetical protein AA0117_g13226 [Alternaria alternata]|uniref:Uncharacterized protein n=1 Tax=Alternaria alternata TaxID=5599 RepID=A0A4Q4MPX0_ALTAL|nr:hypothetical protein AA0117_g13226 [Alternaria alternata]
MAWLARPDNTAWLLILDNVDREYVAQGGDPDAYDVRRYLSGADHGSVLVTTRLARLEQLGESQQLDKVDEAQAKAILESWYKKKHDAAESERLLVLLDGLPLAIAQAGAYLHESGVGLATYLRFYEQQWSALMESDHLANAPLQDYPERSVWTTWAISYQAIRNRHEHTANLLLLWSFLDNKDLWHGLFAAACAASPVATRMLSGWIGDIAGSEIEFSRAMQLLRNYSLVEQVQDTDAMHALDFLFTTQDKLAEAEQMYERALRGYEEVLGPTNRSTLDTVDSLSSLYFKQDKLGEAEKMFERALRGYEERLGSDRVQRYRPALNILESLGDLYAK